METSAIEAQRSVAARSYLQRHPEEGTQTPLSNDVREGLIAISVFSVLSFVLCTVLWFYLTYKLISWRIQWRSRARMIARNIPEPPVLPTLDSYIGGGNATGDTAKILHQRNVQAIRDAEKESPNQFLILIYNLFLADMHQATGFLISTVWLSRDGFFVHTPACFAQGLFNCVGDLAASCFIALIAAHTYMSVVRDYQPPQRVLYASIIFIWLFVYLLPAFSILGTMNGRSIDGFFAVTGAWCFISKGYLMLRLYVHYLYIVICLAITIVLYIAIYIALLRRTRLKARFPDFESRHKRAFLIYPVASVICTLPLVVARLALMAGVRLPVPYYSFAGAMMTSNGFLDCLIFGSTRHGIIFGSTEQVAAKSTGLETFSFVRTPPSRFGNEVRIQGGPPNTRMARISEVGGWWRLPSRAGVHFASQSTGSASTGPRSTSQETLRNENQQPHDPESDRTIRMDIVTTMTVEDRANETPQIQYPEPLTSRSLSYDSLDFESGYAHLQRYGEGGSR